MSRCKKTTKTNKKLLTIINFNFVCISIEKQFYHLVTTRCSKCALAFSNILILIAVKLSVTLIPVPFNFFSFLYIILRVLYLVNFTIIGRGLAFFEDLGLSSLCDLSISLGLIV